MYILVDSNGSMLREVNLRKDFPSTSFPANPTQDQLPQGVYIVDVKPQPKVSTFQYADKVGPVYNGMNWEISWNVRDMTPGEKTIKMSSLENELTADIQNHLDSVARTRGYDGILSLVSYANSTDAVFGPEGIAGRNWRDAVWNSASVILGNVKNGSRAIPTSSALIAELPTISW